MEGSAVGLDGDELLLQLHVSKASPTLKELEESAHRFYEVFRTSPASIGIAEEVAARGFSAPKGLGLRSLRYRARVLGATLAVKRRPQGGTTVRLHLPDAVHEQVEQTEVSRIDLTAI